MDRQSQDAPVFLRADGGPAFPTLTKEAIPFSPEAEEAARAAYGPDAGPPFLGDVTWMGLSVLDYFAASALQGFCAAPTPSGPPDFTARLAYQMAAAMLAERKRLDALDLSAARATV